MCRHTGQIERFAKPAVRDVACAYKLRGRTVLPWYNVSVPGRQIAGFEWRGAFTSTELNTLHAEAFGTRQYTDDEWDWRALVDRHSLGWVVARREGGLVGFVNVVWDGYAHAWLQDVMVALEARGKGTGARLVQVAAEGARVAGCEWLHVDFDDDRLRHFYFGTCGFTPTSAGLIRL